MGQALSSTPRYRQWKAASEASRERVYTQHSAELASMLAAAEAEEEDATTQSGLLDSEVLRPNRGALYTDPGATAGPGATAAAAESSSATLGPGFGLARLDSSGSSQLPRWRQRAATASAGSYSRLSAGTAFRPRSASGWDDSNRRPRRHSLDYARPGELGTSYGPDPDDGTAPSSSSSIPPASSSTTNTTSTSHDDGADRQSAAAGRSSPTPSARSERSHQPSVTFSMLSDDPSESLRQPLLPEQQEAPPEAMAAIDLLREHTQRPDVTEAVAEAIREGRPLTREERDAQGMYETLDFDRCENQLYRTRFHGISPDHFVYLYRFTNKYTFYRWVLCAVIGIMTGLIAFFIDYSVDHFTAKKYSLIDDLLSDCDTHRGACILLPWVVGLAINLGLVLFASCATVYFAPSAAGSGIPEIKCTLNGVKARGWLNINTAVAKITGVIAGVVANMPIGKEGPMIHTGAIVGGGVPQARSRRLGIDSNKTMFRNDRAKRDFVAAGASAGVTAAFGAPIGGVLFVLEEGASFLSQGLIWRTLFTSVMSIFVLRILRSGTLDKDQPNGGWGELVPFGLLSEPNAETEYDANLWDLIDLLVFLAMAIVGGVLGALWNMLQLKITRLRKKYVTTKRRQIIEAALVCSLNTSLFYLTALGLGKCIDIEPDTENVDNLRNFLCDERQFNDLSSLVFNNFSQTIKLLFYLKADLTLGTLAIFFIIIFFLSCWTYGLMIPSGLFMPCLVTGGVFGRFMGTLIGTYSSHRTNIGSYALMGAAAFLGGVVRMTVSLTAILIEATDQTTYTLPIVLTLIVAKFVGDRFNASIYDLHIHFKKIPLLEWESTDEMKRYVCRDVMTARLRCLAPISRVVDVVKTLRETSHNGFPVVVVSEEDNSSGKPITSSIDEPRKFEGQILRSQLITMMEHKCWGHFRKGRGTTQPLLHFKDFLRKYPQRRPIETVELPPEGEIESLYMDLRPYMNPTPYTLSPDAPLPRVFTLFRGLGLRHVPVLDENSGIIGYITRRCLTEHRIEELNELFDRRYYALVRLCEERSIASSQRGASQQNMSEL